MRFSTTGPTASTRITCRCDKLRETQWENTERMRANFVSTALQGVRDALKKLETIIQDKFEFETRVNATLSKRNATQEELAAGITDEELDETEPLFLPPLPTPPGKYMREEASKAKTGTPGSGGGGRKQLTAEEREKARAAQDKARQIEQLLAEASGSDEEEHGAARAGGADRDRQEDDRAVGGGLEEIEAAGTGRDGAGPDAAPSFGGGMSVASVTDSRGLQQGAEGVGAGGAEEDAETRVGVVGNGSGA